MLEFVTKRVRKLRAAEKVRERERAVCSSGCPPICVSLVIWVCAYCADAVCFRSSIEAMENLSYEDRRRIREEQRRSRLSATMS